MPVVAVVGAALGISGGLALGGVLGGIMIAGGAMTAVGTLTGNKDLMQIGALASLGAGIANFASIGVAAGAEKLGEEAAKTGAESAATGVAGEAAKAGVEATGGLVEKASGGFGGVGTDPSVMTGAGGSSPGLINSSIPSSGGFGGVGTDPSVMSSAVNPSAAPVTGVTNAGYVDPVGPSTSSGFGGVGVDKAAGFVPSVPGSTGTFGSRALDFMKANPEATKLGASLIGGAMDSYSKQSILDQQMAQRRAEIQQQIELENQARARYNASITGQRT